MPTLLSSFSEVDIDATSLDIDIANIFPVAVSIGDIVVLHFYASFPGGGIVLQDRPGLNGLNRDQTMVGDSQSFVVDPNETVIAIRYDGTVTNWFWGWDTAYDFIIWDAALISDGGLYSLNANTVDSSLTPWLSPDAESAATGDPIVIRGGSSGFDGGETGVLAYDVLDPNGGSDDTTIFEYEFFITDSPLPDAGILIAMAQSLGDETFVSIEWPQDPDYATAMSWTLVVYGERAGPVLFSGWFTGVVGMRGSVGGG